MDVSENSGLKPPKSSILIGFSITNHPFWGTTILGNPHMDNEYSLPWNYHQISFPEMGRMILQGLRTLMFCSSVVYGGCFSKNFSLKNYAGLIGDRCWWFRIPITRSGVWQVLTNDLQSFYTSDVVVATHRFPSFLGASATKNSPCNWGNVERIETLLALKDQLLDQRKVGSYPVTGRLVISPLALGKSYDFAYRSIMIWTV